MRPPQQLRAQLPAAGMGPEGRVLMARTCSRWPSSLLATVSHAFTSSLDPRKLCEWRPSALFALPLLSPPRCATQDSRHRLAQGVPRRCRSHAIYLSIRHRWIRRDRRRAWLSGGSPCWRIAAMPLMTPAPMAISHSRSRRLLQLNAGWVSRSEAVTTTRASEQISGIRAAFERSLGDRGVTLGLPPTDTDTLGYGYVHDLIAQMPLKVFLHQNLLLAGMWLERHLFLCFPSDLDDHRAAERLQRDVRGRRGFDSVCPRKPSTLPLATAVSAPADPLHYSVYRIGPTSAGRRLLSEARCRGDDGYPLDPADGLSITQDDRSRIRIRDKHIPIKVLDWK